MTRREFPASVKIAAFRRANGHCEGCTGYLFAGKFRYDHVIPDGMGGEPTLENCQVLCLNCDEEKTPGDISAIAKVKRVARKHAGIRTTAMRPMPCGKRSRHSKTMRGAVVPRLTQAEKHRAAMAERRGERL